MNRFNYLADPRRRSQPALPSTFAIENRIRGPLAALVATLILVGGICVMQVARLHAAQREYTLASARLAADDGRIDAVVQLRERIAEKARILDRVTSIRQISLEHSNEFAWIGNHLPAQTWLRVLRYENGSYSLEGSSERIADVGSALLALRETPRATEPRLVSLRDDKSAAARVRYTLRLEAPR